MRQTARVFRRFGFSPFWFNHLRPRIDSDPPAASARNDGGYSFAISRRNSARGMTEALAKGGPAGKTGCALHPRSRVQWHKEVRTRAYRSSGEHPAFPAQWFDGLWRALPGDEFLLPPSPAN